MLQLSDNPDHPEPELSGDGPEGSAPREMRNLVLILPVRKPASTGSPTNIILTHPAGVFSSSVTGQENAPRSRAYSSIYSSNDSYFNRYILI